MNKQTHTKGRRDHLARPMTFFLNEQQHRDVIRALRKHDTRDRARALCRALGVAHEE